MDEDDISDEAKAAIALVRARQAADPRVVVSRAGAAEMLDVSVQTIEELEKNGALISYLEGPVKGRVRRIAIAGVYDRIVLKMIKANPKKGPKPKRNPFFGKRPQDVKRKDKADGAE